MAKPKMAKPKNNGGPAFSSSVAVSPAGDLFCSYDVDCPGMSLRDWFAGHAPEPLAQEVQNIMNREQRANPYNDLSSGKPKVRSETEIRIALVWEWADAMLIERGRM